MLIAAPDFKPSWVEGLSHDDYHADQTAVSSTALRQMLKSPRAFHSYFFDGERPEQTEAMKFGTLVHQVVLEGASFLDTYVVMPEFEGLTLDGRPSTQSKDAKLKKQAWLAEAAIDGLTIVTQDELDRMKRMLDSVTSHPDAMDLLKNGVAELSGYYADPETGIMCRIRPDFIGRGLRTLVDLKTTRDATSGAFSKSVWNLRQDFQLAMYKAGAEAIAQEPIEFCAFIAVENVAPHETAVYVADARMMAKGDVDYHGALRRLRQCLDADAWPRYQERMEEIELPRWVEDMPDDETTERFT